VIRIGSGNDILIGMNGVVIVHVIPEIFVELVKKAGSD
jgi:hypothetical protein